HGGIEFLTANQCMGCHAGLTGPLGPVGFVHTGESKGYGDPGVNVAPFGEWRWTPMGLAGRDPVFLAQLDSELAMIREQFGDDDETQTLAKTLVDTCLRCHSPMAHQHFHQLSEDGETLPLDHLTATTGHAAPETS